MQHPLAGVYVASLTPLDGGFAPDLAALPSLLDFYARRGAHGALLLGTTGEGPSFSSAERREIFRAAQTVRQVHPDFRLLAGTGTPSLQETIDLTRTAFDLGFNGVVVLPPYYFRRVEDDGLWAFFAHVIQRAVPKEGYLLGYHMPSMTGIGFSLDLLARLKETFPSQFAGIKDSSHKDDFAHELGDRFGDDLLVLTGTDSLLLLALNQHAGGCITAPANLISPLLREVWDEQALGFADTAVQARITAARNVLERHAPFPPVLKLLMARLHGFPRWSVRPPLLLPRQDDEEAVLLEWAELGIQ